MGGNSNGDDLFRVMSSASIVPNSDDTYHIIHLTDDSMYHESFSSLDDVKSYLEELADDDVNEDNIHLIKGKILSFESKRTFEISE